MPWQLTAGNEDFPAITAKRLQDGDPQPFHNPLPSQQPGEASPDRVHQPQPVVLLHQARVQAGVVHGSPGVGRESHQPLGGAIVEGSRDGAVEHDESEDPVAVADWHSGPGAKPFEVRVEDPGRIAGGVGDRDRLSGSQAPQVRELVGLQADALHGLLGQPEGLVASRTQHPAHVTLIAHEVGGIAGKGVNHLVQNPIQHLVELQLPVDRLGGFLQGFRQSALPALGPNQAGGAQCARQPGPDHLERRGLERRAVMRVGGMEQQQRAGERIPPPQRDSDRVGRCNFRVASG